MAPSVRCQCSLDSPAFRTYVERAREGRTAPWRIVAGAFLTAAAAIAFPIALALPQILGSQDADSIGRTPLSLALALFSFVGIWVGVWLSVRLLHRRPLSSVLGPDGRIAGGDLVRGFVATLAASALGEVVTYLVDPTIARAPIELAEWLVWLVPLTLALFIQVTAEEIAFRGYLLQSLAARFRSPMVWALIPGLAFTLLHFDPAALPWMNACILINIAGFAAMATLLLLATGNLGAAMGAHLGLNFWGLFVVSHAGWLDGMALLQGRSLQAPGWSLADSLWLTMIGGASLMLALVLLVTPGSPLRVGGPGVSPAAQP